MTTHVTFNNYGAHTLLKKAKKYSVKCCSISLEVTINIINVQILIITFK